MADLAILANEVLVDATIDYTAMDAQQVADSMNALTRTRVKPLMTASEVANAIDPAEWDALTDPQETKVFNLLAMGNLDPRNGSFEEKIITDIFPASTTLSNLQAARQESISRGTEIGYGNVHPRDVEAVRR